MGDRHGNCHTQDEPRYQAGHRPPWPAIHRVHHRTTCAPCQAPPRQHLTHSRHVPRCWCQHTVRAQETFLPWQSDLMSIRTCPFPRHSQPLHQPGSGHLWPEASVDKAWPHTGPTRHDLHRLVSCRPSTSQFIRLTLALISLSSFTNTQVPLSPRARAPACHPEGQQLLGGRESLSPGHTQQLQTLLSPRRRGNPRHRSYQLSRECRVLTRGSGAQAGEASGLADSAGRGWGYCKRPSETHS